MANGLEIDAQTTVEEALGAREDASTDIIFEASLNSIPAASERIAALRQGFEKNRRNNSICFSGRGELGKTASTCNSYDYDVLFLDLRDSQRISENLSYYVSFAEEPLQTGVATAMEALKQVEIDQLVDICTRMVFRDAASHQLRNDIPIIVIVDSRDLSDQDKGKEKLLRRCLE
ncbi:MAG TPA: hypothetical protein VFV70_13210 [Hyphomonadaceae bacterium]|nr:hypothetical protein [Hyphomonadaceae bacterium]